ncbi:hypothetical protein MSEO_30930 [Mycobacterium seoulense]|uniref:DUF3027 domain-containing protein n=1 Tax=Mycobacterium seoulense TaxID=386911 RepID=A0A7I7P271_9MYCO|nr:DUF3027 domain-containing protein [Mycobacterium seoulense]BBY02594.1 hypothetical protein MSEO_30930 [Mycobacterium seoulense]
MQEGDRVTGPIEESAVATVAEWPEGLAAVLTGALDQARAAVVEFSGAEAVGDYLGVSYEDSAAATHRFLAHLPGYQGWQWAVVVAAHPGADHATVSEVVLIPGPTALLAPQWVPWDQRVRPGDLSPGDLLAPAADDPRLVPGYLATGDAQVDETAVEIGLGRRWVMSAWGRAEAAERWHTGDHGPDSPMARSTKRVCRDCGFFLPLAGSLGAMFGVCGNVLSADGQVVDKQYGCGAHSDTPAPAGTGSPVYEPYDDGVLDVVEAPTEVAEAIAPAEEEPAVVTEAPEPAEPDVRSQIEPEVEASAPEAQEAQPEQAEQPEASEAQAEQAEQPEASEAQPEQPEAD